MKKKGSGNSTGLKFESRTRTQPRTVVVKSKGTGKRGHIVADTLLPTQMFPRLPARATFLADANFVSGTQKFFDFVQKHFVSATNVSQFARARKRHEQQCIRNNVSSFATALKLPINFGARAQNTAAKFFVKKNFGTKPCYNVC